MTCAAVHLLPHYHVAGRQHDRDGLCGQPSHDQLRHVRLGVWHGDAGVLPAADVIPGQIPYPDREHYTGCTERHLLVLRSGGTAELFACA